MKNILILSLIISITCLHAMETEFNITHDTQKAPEILPQLHTETTRLRVTAQALQQRVQCLPNHANFDLLSMIAVKMDEHTKAVLLTNAATNFRNPDSLQSLERKALCLEATADCLECAHEQTKLSQAIASMQEMLTQHASK